MEDQIGYSMLEENLWVPALAAFRATGRGIKEGDSRLGDEFLSQKPLLTQAFHAPTLDVSAMSIELKPEHQQMIDLAIRSGAP